MNVIRRGEMIDQLQKIAEDRGGKCLSHTCKDDNTVLWWGCGKGHRWQAAPVKVKAAVSWCLICAEAEKGTKRKNINDMKPLAAEREGRCLSDTYRGARSKLKWKCSKEHQWMATPASVAQGSWCPVCAGNVRQTIESMQSIAKERGGECLSDDYVNSQTKLQWRCSEGHQWEATPNKVKSGRWCPTCYNKTRGDFRRLSLEEMVQIAAARGGRCLSEVYTNNRTKLLWECSQGHTWEAVPSGVKKGTWCPECYVSPLTLRKQERSE
jgi:hypothetical protein